MIHRALLGSIERFFGVLVEHFGGAFPLWLAPEQVCVIPVAKHFNGYGEQVMQKLKEKGFRVYIDDSDDRMNAKIRKAQKMKVPHMLILGEQEEAQGAISVRYRTGKQENGIAFDTYVEMLADRIEKHEMV
ncbi:MAG: His/Gly/Thr/Pro-type tRNA ligase C-terminal domain-containing protein [Sphaerochaetaceae bacterium]|nr:His/Gly/Thr/Pro-type tRNA ligase C-terminal domain-containing protein [Sphaerochaetaceae bacterium]